MELTIYNLFIILSAFFNTPQEDYVRAFAYSGVVVAIIWLALFLLQGLGLYTMAKKRGIGKRFLAFVPFVNTYFLGKLTGDCDVFGRKLKRAWLYTLIGQVLTVLLVAGSLGTQIFLYVNEGAPVQTELGTTYWQEFKHSASLGVYKTYSVLSYIMPIVQLAYEVFLFILVLGLLKQYAPKNYLMLGFLVLFVPLSRYILIFVLRNRDAIDFNAYMRARHEAYMRRQQARYGNPYNNPYGSPYNTPYNNPYATDRKPPEEPFSEFGPKPQDTDLNTQAPPTSDDRTGDGFFD